MEKLETLDLEGLTLVSSTQEGEKTWTRYTDGDTDYYVIWDIARQAEVGRYRI